MIFILKKGGSLKLRRSWKSPLPVCMNARCKELEPLMLNFMEKELAFENTDRELADVIGHLKEMKSLHHVGGLTEKEGRRSLVQCLRTTLVNHPDDLRGRRRANRAREILINHVYQDGGCFFALEEKFSCLVSYLMSCLFSTDQAKKRFRKVASTLEIMLALLWSAAVWILDVYSDASVIYAIWVSVRRLSDVRESEDSHLLILWKCNISHTEDLDTGLDILSAILDHYYTAMLVVICAATLIQIVKALVWVINRSRSRALLADYNDSHARKDFSKDVVCFPFKAIMKMFTTRTGLKDPQKERQAKIEGNFTEEVIDHRTRNVFKMVEAFSESLATSRCQLSYYFAFAFYIGQSEKYGYLDCIASAILEENRSIFVFAEKGWHGMSVLGFSLMMSLVSITTAQFSLYTTKHEFDITLKGKAIYSLSALFGIFARLGGQILFFTTLQIAFFDPEKSYSYVLMFSVPTFVVFYIQRYIRSYVDFWLIDDEISGYSLLGDGYVWPTTSNTMSTIRQPQKDADEETPRNRNFLNWVYLAAKRDKLIWYTNLAFPWITGLNVLGHYPDIYGFADTVASRASYQWRFSSAIGENCSQAH